MAEITEAQFNRLIEDLGENLFWMKEVVAEVQKQTILGKQVDVTVQAPDITVESPRVDVSVPDVVVDVSEIQKGIQALIELYMKREVPTVNVEKSDNTDMLATLEAQNELLQQLLDRDNKVRVESVKGKIEVKFPTTAKEPIAVRLSDGGKFYQAVTNITQAASGMSFPEDARLALLSMQESLAGGITLNGDVVVDNTAVIIELQGVKQNTALSAASSAEVSGKLAQAMVTDAYDEIDMTFPEVDQTISSYLNGGVEVARIQLTYTDSTKKVLRNIKKI